MKHFTGPRGGKDAFGSAINAQTHRINLAMTVNAQTIGEISARTGLRDQRRIRRHMDWLVDHGLADKRENAWALKPSAARILGAQSAPPGFVTYENYKNPKVTIHTAACKEPRKRGGQHKYGQGAYHSHESFIDARRYAESTGLPVVYCSRCKPRDATMSSQVDFDLRLPEEVEETVLFEGAVCRVTINAYERDPKARCQCIEHYGPECDVCHFNFAKVYGDDAAGYIHVHHVRPLSEIGEEYRVNPIEDLRPVCPNCHAMIHLGGVCRTIAEVKRLLKRARRLDI